MSRQGAREWHVVVAAMRSKLLDVAVRHVGSLQDIQGVLRGLDELEGIFRGGHADLGNGSQTDGHVKEAPAIRNRPKTYRVVKQRGELCLEERRGPGSAPFLVPERIYHTLAKVLAKKQGGATAKELKEAVEELLGEETPDYLLRTCIRFWRTVEPRLVRKSGTEYFAKSPESFEGSARAELRKLAT